MGRREWLLILGFVLVGTVVYHLTAPERPDGGVGRSLGQRWQDLRAELRGRSFKLAATRRETAAVGAGIRDIRVGEFRGDVTVAGTDRPDVEAVLTLDVYGADEPDAREQARAVVLAIEPAGDALQVEVRQPPSRRRGRAALHLAVPARLGLAVVLRGGRLEARDLAQVSLDTRLAEVHLERIAGAITGEHRDAPLEVVSGGALRLVTRRASVRIAGVPGEVTLEATDGRLLLRDLGGPVRLEVRRADVELDAIGGTVSVTSSDGRLAVRRAAAAVTFDGRRTRFALEAARAAPLTVTSTDDIVDVTLPPEGARLEIAAEEASVRLPPDTLTVTKEGTTERASGTVGRGTVAWSIRSLRGDIVVRRASGTPGL
jgi:hypothetical protein